MGAIDPIIEQCREEEGGSHKADIGDRAVLFVMASGLKVVCIERGAWCYYVY